MDPEACLLRAEHAIEDRDWTEAREACSNYRTWRSRGGFEPENGDARARAVHAAIPARIQCPEGWHVTGTGGGCTAWQIILGNRYALITDGDTNAPEYDSDDLVIVLYRDPEAIEASDEIAGPHYGNLASCLAWFAENRDRT